MQIESYLEQVSLRKFLFFFFLEVKPAAEQIVSGREFQAADEWDTV
jgi:hypothetical protein